MPKSGAARHQKHHGLPATISQFTRNMPKFQFFPQTTCSLRSPSGARHCDGSRGGNAPGARLPALAHSKVKPDGTEAAYPVPAWGHPSSAGRASFVLPQTGPLLPTPQPPAGEKSGITPRFGLSHKPCDSLFGCCSSVSSAKGLRAAPGALRGPGSHPRPGSGRGRPAGTVASSARAPAYINPTLSLGRVSSVSSPRRAGAAAVPPARAGAESSARRRPVPAAPQTSLRTFDFVQTKLFPPAFSAGKAPACPSSPPPARLPSRRGRCPRGAQAGAAAKPRYLLLSRGWRGPGGRAAAVHSSSASSSGWSPASLCGGGGGGREEGKGAGQRRGASFATGPAEGPPGCRRGPGPGRGQGLRVTGLARPLAFLSSPRAELSHWPWSPSRCRGAWRESGRKARGNSSAGLPPQPGPTHPPAAPRAAPARVGALWLFYRHKQTAGVAGGKAGPSQLQRAVKVPSSSQPAAMWLRDRAPV